MTKTLTEKMRAGELGEGMYFTDYKNDGAVYAGQPKDKLADCQKRKISINCYG